MSYCQAYDSSKDCVACFKNFVLVGGKCERIAARNCLTVANLTACGSCDTGKGLNTTDGVTHCVDVAMPAHCSRTRSAWPFMCEECASGFYLSENSTCVAVQNSISSCEVYFDSVHCLRCAAGFFPSWDNRRCVKRSPEFTSNCRRFRDSRVRCSLCEPGYELSAEYDCVKSAAVERIPGCFVFDPSIARCLLCNKDYEMTPKGECTQFSGV